MSKFYDFIDDTIEVGDLLRVYNNSTDAYEWEVVSSDGFFSPDNIEKHFSESLCLRGSSSFDMSPPKNGEAYIVAGYKPNYQAKIGDVLYIRKWERDDLVIRVVRDYATGCYLTRTEDGYTWGTDPHVREAHFTFCLGRKDIEFPDDLYVYDTQVILNKETVWLSDIEVEPRG